jgi:hypothetical protein
VAILAALDGNNRPEFICEDCDGRVQPAHVRGYPPLCAVCRFIRLEPDLTERFKAHLRGL